MWGSRGIRERPREHASVSKQETQHTTNSASHRERGKARRSALIMLEACNHTVCVAAAVPQRRQRRRLAAMHEPQSARAAWARVVRLLYFGLPPLQRLAGGHAAGSTRLGLAPCRKQV